MCAKVTSTYVEFTLAFGTKPEFSFSFKYNYQYQYFAKVDYKSCFDSIYSHAYTWIIDRDVVESGSISNSSLFACIDRVLMNINGKSSNGIVVGPEYSRMIAEILLQQIDKEVYLILLQEGYCWKRVQEEKEN